MPHETEGGIHTGFDKKTGYYTLRKILGYQAKYNIVLSERGIGKSYGTKAFLLNQEGTSMCLYRQQPDMAHAVEVWLDDVYAQGFDPERFRWDGSNQHGWMLFMDDEPKIWFRYITQVNHIKQETFPDDMNWVWLDEFIPLVYKKLPGVESEGDAIRAIVKTIEHDTVHTREEKGLKPVRVLMFANPFTWNNPILSYFHVLPRGYGIWKVGPGVVCEMVKPLEAPEDRKTAMTVDEFLGDEVNKNQGWLESNSFVKRVPKGAIPEFTIRMGNSYYVRMKSGNRIWICSAKDHKYTDLLKMGDWENLREEEKPITPEIKTALQREAYRGKLLYDNANTKFDYLRDLTALKA